MIKCQQATKSVQIMYHLHYKCNQRKMSVSPEHSRETLVMKVLLLGQSNVGKTSLVTRYTKDKFDAQNNLLTVGIDIRKMEKQVDGKSILLELWDTAGQEKYKTIPTQYFKGVQGILFVYDITDAGSFDRIQDWLDKVEENSDISRVQLSLVGNKLDLESNREVKIQEAQKFAKNKQMNFSEASAKSSKNVDIVFEQIITSIIKRGIKCATKHIKLENNPQCKQPDSESSCCK